jgi:hypothetical protein
VPDVIKVYEEVARVMVSGGLYVSQHKQPVNLQAGAGMAGEGRYALIESYYRNGPLPDAPEGSLHREPGCVEFLHRWEDLLGGLCRSGFVLVDVLEPRHDDAAATAGTFGHRSRFIPPYVALKARRTDRPAKRDDEARLWVPS